MSESSATDQIAAVLCAAIARVRNIDVGHVPLSGQLSEDFGVTSLDMIEIILDAEDALGVRVALESASGSRTLGDLVEVFAQAAAAAASHGAEERPSS